MYYIKKSLLIIKNQGIKIFLVKVIDFLYGRYNKIPDFRSFLLRIFLKRKIKKLKSFQSTKPQEVFDFAFSFCFGAISPHQIKEEFVEFLKIFKEKNLSYILEIGTAKGGTLFCFCKLAKDTATIISIDLPGGYPQWRIPLYHAFKKPNQKLYLLRMDSHKEETMEELKKILNGKQLDFIFIDGDHSYQGVKKDFQMYSPLVKKGGVIVFHDITPNGVEPCKYFWQEIKERFKTNFKEYIKNPNQNWGGIGVLYFD